MNQSANKYKSQLAHIPDCLSGLPLPVWHSGTDSRFIYFNNDWLLFTGRDIGMEYGIGWFEIIHSDDIESFVSNYMTSFQNRDVFKTQVRLKNRYGNYRTVVFAGNPVYSGDELEFAGYTGYFFDITEMLQENANIVKQLNDKRILLREMYHRTKNNLQVVSSLLALQSDRIADERVIRQLTDGQNRLKTMAYIHEYLSKSTDLRLINFRDYAHSLIMSICSSYSDISRQVLLDVKIDNFDLDVEIATPCGLVITELISNSFKYAFRNNGTPELDVNIFISDENMLNIIIADNGPGLPENIELTNTSTLGFQLVSGLIDQLRGTIKYSFVSGSRFEIQCRTAENKGGSSQ